MAAALSTSLQLQRATFNSSSRAPGQQRPAARRALAVRADAAPKPPQGVTLPPAQPVVPPATCGFVENAERLNSRAAMIGFLGLLLVEALCNRGILDVVGITTGKGLGFEF